jgi:hypothetical protein
MPYCMGCTGFSSPTVQRIASFCTVHTNDIKGLARQRPDCRLKPLALVAEHRKRVHAHRLGYAAVHIPDIDLRAFSNTPRHAAQDRGHQSGGHPQHLSIRNLEKKYTENTIAYAQAVAMLSFCATCVSWKQHLYQHPSTAAIGGQTRGKESKAARDIRLDAIVDEWAQPFGGIERLPPASRMLARKAAALSTRRAKTLEDETRIANIVSRLLAQAGLASSREPRLLEPVESEPEHVAPGFARVEIMQQVAEAEAKRGKG